MIGQYLSNTNEIGTIRILQNILDLKKAFVLCGLWLKALGRWVLQVWPLFLSCEEMVDRN
jgi:hypothetical protein